VLPVHDSTAVLPARPPRTTADRALPANTVTDEPVVVLLPVDTDAPELRCW
jgi:hypothetical protein